MIDRDLTVTRYFAGDLDPNETADLSTRIKSDKENAQWFAEQVFIQAR